MRFEEDSVLDAWEAPENLYPAVKGRDSYQIRTNAAISHSAESFREFYHQQIIPTLHFDWQITRALPRELAVSSVLLTSLL